MAPEYALWGYLTYKAMYIVLGLLHWKLLLGRTA